MSSARAQEIRCVCSSNRIAIYKAGNGVVSNDINAAENH